MSVRRVKNALTVGVAACIGFVVPFGVIQVRHLPLEGVLGEAGRTALVAISPVIILLAVVTSAERTASMLVYCMMNGIVYGLATITVLVIRSRRGWWRWAVLGLLIAGWLAYAHVLATAVPWV